jgi:hypothetical protein
MPQLEPEFELMNDGMAMVTRLCDMYPDQFGHIEPKLIMVAAIVNKPQPQGQSYDSAIVGIKPPVTLCTDKRYIIHFYKNVWDGYTDGQRALLIASKLLRVDDECSGGVLPEDLKDVRRLVKAFGPDYHNDPAVPDILAVKQIF